MPIPAETDGRKAAGTIAETGALGQLENGLGAQTQPVLRLSAAGDKCWGWLAEREGFELRQ